MYICVWIHAHMASWRALLTGLAALFHERQNPGLDRKIHFEAHCHFVDALRYFTRTQKGTSCFEFFVFWGFEFLAFLGIEDADKGGGNLSLEPKGLWQRSFAARVWLSLRRFLCVYILLCFYFFVLPSQLICSQSAAYYHKISFLCPTVSDCSLGSLIGHCSLGVLVAPHQN